MKNKNFVFFMIGLMMLPALASFGQDQAVNEYGRTVNVQEIDPEVWSGIISFQSKDGDYRLWFDNRVYFDAAYFFDENALNPQGNGTKIRRARFAVKAKLWKNWYGEVDLDFAGAALELKDAYVRHSWFDKNDNEFAILKLGNFREPFSMETTTTSRYITFIERSFINKFAPSRQIGIGGAFWKEKFLTQFGVFFNEVGELEATTLSADRNKGMGMDEGYSLTGRFVYNPVIDANKMLHIGVSGSYRTPKTSDEVLNGYRYSTRSISSINRKKYIDTDDVDNVDTRTLYGFELAGMYKNFMFQGEYIGSNLEGTNLNGIEGMKKASFGGSYIQAGVLLFGGRYVYNKSEGEFTNVRRGRKWGDIEYAMRLEYVDATDLKAEIYGGAGEAITCGLNYHVNPNLKFALNYTYANHDRYANGKGKLYVGHNADGDLTADFIEIVEPAGKGGDSYGFIQTRVLIAF